LLIKSVSIFQQNNYIVVFKLNRDLVLGKIEAFLRKILEAVLHRMSSRFAVKQRAKFASF
jgi:hypothetical protein